MKKLQLDADRLTVDSFQTESHSPAVFMDAATRPEVCDPFTLPPRCS